MYDRHIGGRAALSELIDASSLLWRLQLAGVDAGARWSELAAAWAPRAEDAHCAFADLHAMMAFAGARLWEDAERLRALPPVAQRLGGSHAQRDVLFLTRAAAAAPRRRATAASPRRAPPPARGAWRAASPALAAS